MGQRDCFTNRGNFSGDLAFLYCLTTAYYDETVANNLPVKKIETVVAVPEIVLTLQRNKTKVRF